MLFRSPYRVAYEKLGKNYTHDKLVAELSFGVWVFLFAGKQYQAGGNVLLSIFPKRPYKVNQKVIYQKLNQINSLRNRVAHHEPIVLDQQQPSVQIMPAFIFSMLLIY